MNQETLLYKTVYIGRNPKREYIATWYLIPIEGPIKEYTARFRTLKELKEYCDPWEVDYVKVY
jgi:hypothetical protein